MGGTKRAENRRIPQNPRIADSTSNPPASQPLDHDLFHIVVENFFEIPAKISKGILVAANQSVRAHIRDELDVGHTRMSLNHQKARSKGRPVVCKRRVWWLGFTASRKAIQMIASDRGGSYAYIPLQFGKREIFGLD